MLDNTKRFIDELNSDLMRERKAQIQYEQHASLLAGPFFAFVSELLTHAEEERGHALLLNDLIVVLGGVPVVDVLPPEVSTQCQAMIKQDLSGEEEAIARYKDRLSQAEIWGIREAVPTLLEILKDEVSHSNDLKSILEE